MPGRSQKIDRKRLHAMLKNGQTQQQCAEYFKCSPAAICIAAKKLNYDRHRVAAMEHASDLVDSEIDALRQLKETNQRVMEQIDLYDRWTRNDPAAI